MNRTQDFDEMVSKTLLKSKITRQEFILSLIEDHNLEVEEALRESILTIGQTEFSKLANIPVGRIGDYVRNRRQFKPSSLDGFLAPFGLQIGYVLKKKTA